MEELINKLENIAKKNGDVFHYSLNIRKNNNKLIYEFTAIEAADGHFFIREEGRTILQAIENALKVTPDACKAWGYKA